MPQDGLKIPAKAKGASWRSLLRSFVSGFQPYAKPLGSALAKKIYAVMIAGFGATGGLYLVPAQATKNVELTAIVKGIPGSCKANINDVSAVLQDEANYGLDVQTWRVIKPNTDNSHAFTAKQLYNNGDTENLTGTWHEKGGIVAVTADGQPNELASYRFTYDWKKGFYIGLESSHDCVLDANVVCPVVVGEKDKIDAMRAALDGRKCVAADKT